MTDLLKNNMLNKTIADALEDSSVSSEFLCKCKKQKGWITEGKETLPCPECGRTYIGIYDKKNLTIKGKVIKRKRIKEIK